MTGIRDEVVQVVFRSLRSLAPRRWEFHMNEHLDTILNPRNDDGAAMVFDLERTFKVRIPRPEWQKIITVGDVVELMLRHLPEENNAST